MSTPKAILQLLRRELDQKEELQVRSFFPAWWTATCHDGTVDSQTRCHEEVKAASLGFRRCFDERFRNCARATFRHFFNSFSGVLRD